MLTLVQIFFAFLFSPYFSMWTKTCKQKLQYMTLSLQREDVREQHDSKQIQLQFQ